MKLNKACPAHKLCELNNLRVGELWGHECPRGLKSGKRDFTECVHYEEWERDGELRTNNGTSGKHT